MTPAFAKLTAAKCQKMQNTAKKLSKLLHFTTLQLFLKRIRGCTRKSIVL